MAITPPESPTDKKEKKKPSFLSGRILSVQCGGEGAQRESPKTAKGESKAPRERVVGDSAEEVPCQGYTYRASEERNERWRERKRERERVRGR